MKRYIIPIFIPHYGCPQNCVFCDQKTITGNERPVDETEVKAIIQSHLTRLTQPRQVEIAFYGGSFTALPPSVQIRLLSPAKEALDRREVQAIRVSTRPDAVDSDTAIRLIDYGVSTVELGVQSLDDRVLAAANRGHFAAAVPAAVAVLKKFNLTCGLQLMPGLPGEDWLSLIRTATLASQLEPDFVRIYPTVVLAGTALADLYSSGRYQPLSLSAAVSRTAYLKLLFDRQAIPVIRYGLQATVELSREGTVVAGPYHPAFGEMVASYIFHLMVSRFLENKITHHSEELLIHHHPLDHSRLRGQCSSNLQRWKNEYPLIKFQLVADWPSKNELGIVSGGCLFIINDAMLIC